MGDAHKSQSYVVQAQVRLNTERASELVEA